MLSYFSSVIFLTSFTAQKYSDTIDRISFFKSSKVDVEKILNCLFFCSINVDSVILCSQFIDELEKETDMDKKISILNEHKDEIKNFWVFHIELETKSMLFEAVGMSYISF